MPTGSPSPGSEPVSAEPHPELLAAIATQVRLAEETQHLLHRVLKGLSILATAVTTLSDTDQTLVTAVNDLATEFPQYEAAFMAQITSLKASPAAQNDPTVLTAATNIENIVAQMKSGIAALAPVAAASAPSSPTDTSSATTAADPSPSASAVTAGTTAGTTATPASATPAPVAS